MYSKGKIKYINWIDCYVLENCVSFAATVLSNRTVLANSALFARTTLDKSSKLWKCLGCGLFNFAVMLIPIFCQTQVFGGDFKVFQIIFCFPNLHNFIPCWNIGGTWKISMPTPQIVVSMVKINHRHHKRHPNGEPASRKNRPGYGGRNTT